jgi:hypothetical protein
MNDEPIFTGPASLPAEPTRALPGSPEKIQVLTERASRGEHLFHPQDGVIQLEVSRLEAIAFRSPRRKRRLRDPGLDSEPAA